MLVFVFVLPYLAPEGLRAALLGSHADEPVAIAHVEADEHLDLVAPARFVFFVAGVAHGDFGRSYVQPVDVERELAKHALLTVALVAMAIVLTRNALGPATVFGVLAFEAVLGLRGLGTLFADAVDVRDLVMVRAVLTVVLLSCVALPRATRAAGRLAARSVQRAAVTVAGVWLFALAIAVAFAQRLPLPDPDELALRSAGPSLSHWLGTDDLGRDVMARLVWGAQGTLLLGAAATAAGFVVGLIVGALAAESPAARRGVAWTGRAGIPAVGVAVALASVLSRDPFVLWQWLVPVAVGPAVAFAVFALAGPPPGAGSALEAGAVVAVAMANAVAAEAVLGALGCVAPGTLTWGALLGDVRRGDHRAWLQLAVVIVAVVGTVAALRAVSSAIRSASRRLIPAPAGTMS